MEKSEAKPHRHETLVEMTLEKQTLLVTAIRDRRLKLRRIFEEAQKAKEEAKEASLVRSLEKQLSVFSRELDRVDKTLDKATDRANKIIALMLGLGFDRNRIDLLINIMKGEGK